MKRPTRLQKWWYRRGHRPQPGSRLYSPALAVQYVAMEAVLGLKHHIAEAQRRMGQTPNSAGTHVSGNRRRYHYPSGGFVDFDRDRDAQG